MRALTWQGMEKVSVEEVPDPRIEQPTDAVIRVTSAAICGSDIHTLSSGWGPTNYPCVVGHEIVGKAVRVGKDVKNGVKVGDRVGVGAQSGACLKGDCASCADGSENYCQVGGS